MGTKLEKISTDLPGLFVLAPVDFEDQRGIFVKTFHSQSFEELGLESDFKESFYSISHQNVIRGMHFHTPPCDHCKLVYVPQGLIMDVALDLRAESPTYGRHFAIELNESNRSILYIPRGFAHGFMVKSQKALVVYLQTGVHSPPHDCGILWSSIGMSWNCPSPIISERDSAFPSFTEFETPFRNPVELP